MELTPGKVAVITGAASGIGWALRRRRANLAGQASMASCTAGIVSPHVQRVIDEGMAPAAVADLVADAIAADRFWVFTDPHFTEMALDPVAAYRRRPNPQTELDLPGFPASQRAHRGDPAAADGSRGLTASRSFLAGASDQSSQASCATLDTS